MRVAFDPAKDVANQRKHGISLQAAASFEWDTALEREDDRFDYGEVRFVAIGLIDARLYVMIFTEGPDDDTVRIIACARRKNMKRGTIMNKFDPKVHDDNLPLDAAFMAGMKPSRRGRPKLEAPKVEVKIRLDAQTVEYLRGSGPGWQTRVNALLGQLVAKGQI